MLLLPVIVCKKKWEKLSFFFFYLYASKAQLKEAELHQQELLEPELKPTQKIKRFSCFRGKLTDGPGSERVIVKLIDLIFLLYQPLVFLLQRTVIVQGLEDKYKKV